MYITFKNDTMAILSVSGIRGSILKKEKIGESVTEFLNYYHQYDHMSDSNTVSMPELPHNDLDAERLINNMPITREFYKAIYREENAVQLMRRQIIDSYTLLRTALSDIDSTKNHEDKLCDKFYFLQTEEDFDPKTGIFLRPRAFKSMWLKVENQREIVLVYEIEQLIDYLVLDYTYSLLLFGPSNIKLCPYCGKAFFAHRQGKMYCCKRCKDQAAEEKIKKNPYYNKYRIQQKKHNELYNLVISTDSAQGRAIADLCDRWNEWAKKECDTAMENLQKKKMHDFSLYFDTLDPRNYPDAVVEDVDLFGERIKKKWKQMLVNAKY